MPDGSSQSSQRVYTHVVYDAETGEIFHIHHAVALPGIQLPDEIKLRAAAMDTATKITGRPAQQIEILSVREEELKRGATYKVDVKNKCLVAKQSDRGG